MASIKKYCNVSGNSILESVIALSIISVCLYIAIMVYASVFSPRTSPKFYSTYNKLDELFFLSQVQSDSINTIENDNLTIEEELINTNLKQVTIKYKDSSKIDFEKSYYIQQSNE
jgi:hypothetical protein